MAACPAPWPSKDEKLMVLHPTHALLDQSPLLEGIANLEPVALQPARGTAGDTEFDGINAGSASAHLRLRRPGLTLLVRRGLAGERDEHEGDPGLSETRFHDEHAIQSRAKLA